MIQILNGTIDPSWVIVILGGVVAFFLVRTLQKMEARMDKHEIRSNIITRVLLQMCTKMGADDDFYHELSEQLNKEQ